MCVYDITELEILEEDLTAYKAVSVISFPKPKFSSLWHPVFRVSQFNDTDDEDCFYPQRCGDVFTYEIGEKVTSSFETTPGLYCFEKKDGAKNIGINADLPSTALLEVLIPKGTKIRRALSSLGLDLQVPDVILTEELIPIKVVKKEDYSVHS